MLPTYVYQYQSFLSIVVMDDVVRISRSLYAVLNTIIGADEQVYVRRTATNLRDHIIRMEGEWTNEDKIPCYSGSKAEGLRFKSSDEDWMYIYRCIKVVQSESYTKLYDISTTCVFVMENEMTKPGFTLLRCANVICNLVHKDGRSPIVPMLNGRYVSSKLWREINAQDGSHPHTIFLHGPCSSGFISDDEYDWAHCLKCDIWPEKRSTQHQETSPKFLAIQS